MAWNQQTSPPLQKLHNLQTPAFIVNRHAFRENCKNVRSAAFSNGILRLRPHVKTHKTREGCVIQAGLDRDGGDGNENSTEVIGFVVSTIPELSMVVDLACRHRCKPFNDILFGIPVCQSKLEVIQQLKSKLTSAMGDDCSVHVLVDHPSQIDFLENFIRNNGQSADKDAERWTVFLKLDTGYHRAGITCDLAGVELAAKIIESSFLALQGVYSHCGHSYSINDEDAMKHTARTDHDAIVGFIDSLKNRLEIGGSAFDTSSLQISVGSTPSLFCHKNLVNVPNLLDLHPGNYVFFDRQQLWTGACKLEIFIAGFVLTRVIGHYNDSNRNAIMVDAGATALTKETSPQGDMCAVFGRPELECYRMSQEVTMIRRRRDSPYPNIKGSAFPFDEFPLGSVMLLVPNHSCLAAACFDHYHVVEEVDCPFSSDAAVVDVWKPVSGWA